LPTARVKTNKLWWQTFRAIRRELKVARRQTWAKANLGVVKTELTEGKVATAAAVSIKGGGEQINGREAKQLAS
jgi:hypothetical protein